MGTVAGSSRIVRLGHAPLQDAYWKHCFETLTEEIEDKKGTDVVHDIRKICEKCAKTFLALESVQGFLRKLVWVICCCGCLLVNS